MNSQIRRNAFEWLLIDLNTQCDFLLPRGALPVCNRAEVIPNIRRLMNWARLENRPVISSLECRRPAELRHGLPPHCIERTPGQRKLPFTLLPSRILLAGDNTLDLPIDPFRRYQQLIFSKRERDFLSNPKADRLMNCVRAKNLLVFGVTTEQCIKAAVLSLLARQHSIALVTDACGYWSAAEADLAMRQMDAKGAALVTTDDVLTGRAQEKIEAALAARAAVASAEDDALLGDARELFVQPIPTRPVPLSRDSSASHAPAGHNGNGNGSHLTPANPARRRAGLPIPKHAAPANGKSHPKSRSNGKSAAPSAQSANDPARQKALGSNKPRRDLGDLVPPHLLSRKSRGPSRPLK